MTTNVSPIYDPEARAAIWHRSEIFTGPQGTGQFVPKINDLVYDTEEEVLRWWRVSAINLGNFLSTLVPLITTSPQEMESGVLGLGLGSQRLADTAFLYIDKSVVPYSATIESRRYIYGTDKAYCKVFAGTDITGVGRVISAVYDSSGNFVSENVSLSVVASDAYNNNVGIKTVDSFKTSANLQDGEVVTLVCYNTSGAVTQIERFRVMNTTFVRKASAGVRTVVGIALNSPFLYSQNVKTLYYPRNLPLSADNLSISVFYNDGSQKQLPVDGEIVEIVGLDAYDALDVNQEFPLVVKYKLATNEQSYGLDGGQDFVSETYKLVTAQANRSYEVRLSVFPRWIDANQGYALTWWLLDATRSISIDVSDLVEITSGSFAPKAYGVKQTLTARLDMSKVLSSYVDYFHVQSVDVRLQAPGTFRQNASSGPNWYVSSVSGAMPMAGQGAYATFLAGQGSLKTFRVDGYFQTQADWLQALYSRTLPIVLSPEETTPPAPTHFTLHVNGSTFQYPISSWNQDLQISVAAANNDTVYIVFEYAGQELLELGVMGMPLYQRNADGSYV